MQLHSKEQEALTACLAEGEPIGPGVKGTVRGDGLSTILPNMMSAVVLPTDRRIVIISKSLIGKAKCEEINYTDISTISHKVMSTMQITVTGHRQHKWYIYNVEKNAGEPFVNHLLYHLASIPLQPGQESGPAQRINDQWEAVRPRQWGTNKHNGERQMLYDLIDAGEDIECLIGGQFGPDVSQARIGNTFHQGICIATSKRVLMVDKGLLGSTEVAEMPYRNIETITYSTGMMLAGVRITGRGTASFRIEMVQKSEVQPFVDCVRSHLDEPLAPQPAQVVQPGPVPQPSNLDDLERLAGLLERGLVTREEFDAKKKQLLGL